MTATERERLIKLCTQISLSLIVVAFSIYLITTKDATDASTKWAYGMIGLVVGYWLR